MIQRYHMEQGERRSFMDENSSGQWVRYEDYVAELTAAQLRINELERAQFVGKT